MIANIFMIASVIAVLSIMIIFKVQADKLKKNPDDIEKIQTRFFIGVAIAELIPTAFIIYGYMNVEPVTEISELFIPAFVIFLSMAVASFFIFLQSKESMHKEVKGLLTTFAFVGNAVAMAIPLISLIGLLLMLPK